MKKRIIMENQKDLDQNSEIPRSLKYTILELVEWYVSLMSLYKLHR